MSLRYAISQRRCFRTVLHEHLSSLFSSGDRDRGRRGLRRIFEHAGDLPALTTSFYLGAYVCVIGFVIFCLKLINHLTTIVTQYAEATEVSGHHGEPDDIRKIFRTYMTRYFMPMTLLQHVVVLVSLSSIPPHLHLKMTTTNNLLHSI